MASVPRLYQLELAELAAGQNLIVNLPTGAGKTLIASLVVSHYADELLAAASRGVRLHIVFLAPRRTLVHQQAGVLDACCPLRVRTFTAESCVDFWDRAAWEHELSLADVLVATPAVVLDALNKAYLRLADVLLLVLDEAHNAAKSDPAAVLMREHYARADPAARPRVLGLTASPLNGRAGGGAGGAASCVAPAVAKLEALLQATLVCSHAHADEVRACAPAAEVVVARHPPCPWACDEEEACAAPGTSEPAVARRALAAALPALGLWGAAAAVEHVIGLRPAALWCAVDGRGCGAAPGEDGVDSDFAAPLSAAERDSAARRPSPTAAVDAAELAAGLVRAAARRGVAGAALLSAAADDGGASAADASLRAPAATRLAAALLRHPATAPAALAVAAGVAGPALLVVGAGEGEVSPWLAPKLSLLLRLLCAEHSAAAARGAAAATSWRALVFVQRRSTAAAVARLLQTLATAAAAAAASPSASPTTYHASLASLSCGCAVGCAAGDAASARSLAASLVAFRAGAAPVLVATSVLEEGIDVPTCGLVVLFDPKRNVRSFLQSRGRARAAASRLLALAPADDAGAADALLAAAAQAEAEMGEVAARRAAAARRTAAAAGEAEPSDDDEADGSAAAAAPPAWMASARGPARYTVAATGATCSLTGAVGLLHAYSARLPHDAYAAPGWGPAFSEDRVAAAQGPADWAVTVRLPGHAWFTGAASGPQPGRRAARAAAALAAVAALHAGGALTDHLVPAPDEGCAAAAEDEAAGEEEEEETEAEAAAAAEPGGAADAALVAAASAAAASAGGLLSVEPAGVRLRSRLPTALLAGGGAVAGGDAAALAGDWLAYELVPLQRPRDEAGARAGAAVAPARLALLSRAPLHHAGDAAADGCGLPPLRLVRFGRPAPAALHPLPLRPGQGAAGASNVLSIEPGSDAARSAAAFTAWADARFFAPFQGCGSLRPLALPLTADGGVAAVDWACLADQSAPWWGAADAGGGDASLLPPPPPVGYVVLHAAPLEPPAAFYALRVAQPQPDVDAPMGGEVGAPTLAQHYAGRGVPRPALDRAGPWLEAAPARPQPRNLLVPHVGAAATGDDGDDVGPPVARRRLASRVMLLPSRLAHVAPGWTSAPTGLRSDLHAALTDLPASLRALRAALLAAELATLLTGPRPALPLPESAYLFAPPPSAALNAHRPPAALVDALVDATASGSAAEPGCWQTLECVGDAWLKHAAGLHVWAAAPAAHEGALTRARARLVSNAALRRAALASGLVGCVRTEAFCGGGGGCAEAGSPGRPPLLRAKSLADVVEAALGAAATACGERAAWRAARRLGVLPPAPDGDGDGGGDDGLPPSAAGYAAALAALQASGRAAASPSAPALEPLLCDDASRASLAPLERRLGVTFGGAACPARGRSGRLALLDEAVTHPSAPAAARGAPAYGRLEFLGDGVLDWAAVRALLARSGGAGGRGATAGALSTRRAALLNNGRLACVAFDRLRLGTFVAHGSDQLHADVLRWARDRAAPGGPSDAPRVRTTAFFGLGGGSAPKVLADVLEAVAGALFADSGFSQAAVESAFGWLLFGDDGGSSADGAGDAGGGGAAPPQPAWSPPHPEGPAMLPPMRDVLPPPLPSPPAPQPQPLAPAPPPGADDKHPVSALLEACVRAGLAPLSFVVDGGPGASPPSLFRASVHAGGVERGAGAGQSVKEARRAAAEDALRRWSVSAAPPPALPVDVGGKHPVSALFEVAARVRAVAALRSDPPPEPGHATFRATALVDGVEWGHGAGATVKEARRAAAEEALRRWPAAAWP